MIHAFRSIENVMRFKPHRFIWGKSSPRI